MKKLPSIFGSKLRKRLFIGLIINGFGQAAVAVATALLVRKTFRELIRHHHFNDTGKTVLIGIGFLLIAVVSAALRMHERTSSEKIGQSYSHSVRVKLFDHLSRMAPRSLQQRSRGAVVLRFVGDLNALKRWVSLGIARLSVAGITAVGALGALAFINPVLALGAAIVIAISAILLLRLGEQLREAAKEGRRRRSYLAANVNEKVSSIAVVQVFGQLDREKRKLRKQSKKLSKAMIARAAKIGELRAATRSTSILATAVVLLLGASEVSRGRATPGTVVAAMTVVHLLVSSLRSLGRVQEYRQVAKVATEKIKQFLKSSELVREINHPVKLKQGPGKIEFVNVCLNGILDSVSAVAKPKKRIAITGPNGSGKSTLLWLAARLIDPDEGSIRIDRQNIAKCSLTSLRRAVGIVSPDLPLLRGKLITNITYRWPEAPRNEVDRIIKLCDLDEVINSLPGGEEAKVIEEGQNLSLGQRQRVSLARALLGNPRILLLDEADVHLDQASSTILDRVLESYNGTVLMVTHDSRRLEMVDEVWHMEDGHLRIEKQKKKSVQPEKCFFQHGRGRKTQNDILAKVLKADGKTNYFVYLPERSIQPRHLLVAVHGISRNAKELVRYFAPFARSHNFMVIAPLFDPARYRGYQRLGLGGHPPDFALDQIISEVNEEMGTSFSTFYLFGYSGGAQFAHRYMMAFPDRVNALCAASAGWYTFPDYNLRFPQGLRPNPRLADIHFDLNEILKVPTCVLVGSEDTKRDENLRKSKKLDRLQGKTRLERGKHWIKAMTSAARYLNFDTEYRFEILPGCGHSFKDGMIIGNMGERVFEFFLTHRKPKGERVYSFHSTMYDEKSIAKRVMAK